MKLQVVLLSVFLVFFVIKNNAQTDSGSLRLVEVRKIWDNAEHSAFTDLVRYKGRFICVFREGKKHAGQFGTIRVIFSENGIDWISEALIKSSDSDLRDPKITITPKGDLMINAAAALKDRTKGKHQSLTWFSQDGKHWGKRYEIGDLDFWLWKVTWHGQMAYGIGYKGSGKDKSARFYQSKDGKSYDVLIENFAKDSLVNEGSLVFKDDKAFCLLRRDGDSPMNTGLVGISDRPYSNWTWKDLKVRIAGPDLMLLPDGRFLAVVRKYGSDGWFPAYTALCWVDPYSGTLKEALKLPSGGDTSYGGMLMYDGMLWVSYYSSHEGKTAIYLAKVEIV